MLVVKSDAGILPRATRVKLPTMAEVAQAATGALKIKATASLRQDRESEPEKPYR
jgi:hypothetical protein